MKKVCKSVNITDPHTIFPYISDCLDRHATRYDFGRLLIKFGMSPFYYGIYKRSRSAKFIYKLKRMPANERRTMKYKINLAVRQYNLAKSRIADYVARAIKYRTARFDSIVYSERYDPTTGKTRLIGKEDPLQQVFDYVAVRSCDELFGKKIVKQQASSIKGRGQIYGVNIIRRWVAKDNQSARWASTHNRKYTRKCKWCVKLDIKKCYPSANMDIFMKFLRHDCANEDIIWLWEIILKSHKSNGYTGFMIGSFPSQWAMQYLLSYAYRYAMNSHSIRRGKRIKNITHALLFMDDIGLFGSSRKSLKKGVQDLIIYIKDTFGLDIKPNWHIHEFSKSGMDMMGYVVHSTGKVTMRGRNYIKSRRMVLRYYARKSLSLKQAKRLLSYKGFFKHSSCLRKANKMYHISKVFKYAANLLSKAYKNNDGGTRRNVKRIGYFDRTAKFCTVQRAA